MKGSEKGFGKKSISRIICLAVISVMILTQTAVPSGYVYGSSDISSEIASKEKAVKKAKDNLSKAQKQYEEEKKAAEENIKISESELANVGREFIDYMVEQAYATDKKNISGIKSLSNFTIAGCIKKAYANEDCKAVITKMNKNASSDKDTFEGTVDRALTEDNIRKAISFMEKCNTIRKSLDLPEYKVSPYLMSQSAVATAIESQTKTHTYVNSGCFINVRGNKVYDSIANGFTDPFTFWYDSEKAKADRGETTGIAHYKAIISQDYKQTGACWLNNVKFAEQSFSYDDKGTAYTTAKFKKLFNSFIAEKKEQLLKEKEAGMELFNTKPDYLKKAESDLAKAKKALKSTVQNYQPSISTSNYSYDKIKVKYAIPKGFDGIKILRSKTGKAKTFTVKKNTGTGTSYIDTGLTTGNIFYYKACLYKVIDGKNVITQYSDCIKEKVRPAKVTGISAQKTKKGKLYISWTAIRGASGYDIYIKRPGDSNAALLKTGKNIRGLSLNSRDAKSHEAYASVLTHGEYIIKVRAYRTVNGKKVPGYCSKEVTITL